MKIESVIAISSSAGTVKAGLVSFKKVFEKRPDIKNELNVTDKDMKIILSAIEIFDRIYKDVKTKIG